MSRRRVAAYKNVLKRAASLAHSHRARVKNEDSWDGAGLVCAAERSHGLVVGELLQAGINRNHAKVEGHQKVVWLSSG